MMNRTLFTAMFLVVCVACRAQTASPSVTVGTHVLTLGMPESTVLEQLGQDLRLQYLQPRWYVSKRVGSAYEIVGHVTFDNHQLNTVTRYWEVNESSSKSFFYAITDAIKSIEHDGMTTCQISSSSETIPMDLPSGRVSNVNEQVLLSCGVKKVTLLLHLSGTPELAENLEVIEELR